MLHTNFCSRQLMASAPECESPKLQVLGYALAAETCALATRLHPQLVQSVRLGREAVLVRLTRAAYASKKWHQRVISHEFGCLLMCCLGEQQNRRRSMAGSGWAMHALTECFERGPGVAMTIDRRHPPQISGRKFVRQYLGDEHLVRQPLLDLLLARLPAARIMIAKISACLVDPSQVWARASINVSFFSTICLLVFPCREFT